MFEFENASIRKKLILIQLATAFLAVLICCFFFLYNDIKVFRESSIKSKTSIAEIIGISATPALEFIDHHAAAQMLSNLKSNSSILNAMIVDKEGKEFARYDKPGEESFSFPAAGESELDNQKSFGQRFIVSYKIKDEEFLGSVMLRSEITGFSGIILGYLKIALLILGISLLVAFVISSLLQGSISERLLSLVYKTKEVAKTNDYSIRVSTEGKDEVATLSSSFNNMLGEIEKMQNTLKGTNIELEKRVKERTIELETANAELERFVYVASHDLQEPLRTITNYTGMLQDRYAEKFDDTANKYLASTIRAATRMRTLIKDLLELSRVGKDKKITYVDTNEILKEVLAQLEASIAEKKAVITSSVLPVIKGNEVEMKQLFQNLISNSLKFQKEDSVPEIKITAEEKANEYLFTFKDNGIGIAEEYKNRIFIVFQRLHGKYEYAGTGIGLATCKKIVALHNGNIWVESKPGEGSTFYFTISKNLSITN